MPRDIIDTIESEFHGLSRQLQKAARFILDSPDQVAFHSMREIATLADVLPPTLQRLAKKLGFSSYNEFRNEFRDRLTTPVGAYAARARKLQLRRSMSEDFELLQEISDAGKLNIEQSFAEIENGTLREAARTLINAENIHVIGLRKCFPIAFYFHYATRIFFPHASLIQATAGAFHEEIANISDNDAALAIAFDPYTTETVLTAKTAHKANAKLIAITDSSVSPIHDIADYPFTVANRSPSFYRSLVGALALAEALVAVIVSELGETAAEKLETSENLLRGTGTYWSKGDSL